MASESEETGIDLSEESMIELDKVTWQYFDAVKNIMHKHTDAELIAFAADESASTCQSPRKFWQAEASFEVTCRELFKRAEKFMSGSSGAYCVYHDSDMKDCSNKHEDE